MSLAALLWRVRREFCAGCLMILFGLVAAINGPSYRVGTLMHMGPGFMPTVLGIVLIFLGIAIVGTAMVGGGVTEDEANLLPDDPQWLAWLCILAGPLMFIVFGKIGGLAPATFACVFVSSLGDHRITWKGAFLLAAGVTVFGVVLFHYVLQIPMPVLQWNPPLEAFGL